MVSVSCAASAGLIQGLADDHAGLSVASGSSDMPAVLLNMLGVLSRALDCVLCACG